MSVHKPAGLLPRSGGRFRWPQAFGPSIQAQLGLSESRIGGRYDLNKLFSPGDAGASRLRSVELAGLPQEVVWRMLVDEMAIQAIIYGNIGFFCLDYPVFAVGTSRPGVWGFGVT